MDVRVGDKLIMKKNHPCGSNEFAVLRIGMDFRIRCLGCGARSCFRASRRRRT